MKNIFFILTVISFNCNSENITINLHSGDLIGNAYNYFSGNSQDNPTIFDSERTKQNKLDKIKKIEQNKTLNNINSKQLNSQTNKFLNQRITKQGLINAGTLSAEGIVAEKAGKSIYKKITQNTIGTVAVGTVAYAGAEIASNITYQEILQSPLYNEIYNELQAKASLVDEKTYKQNKKTCSKSQAKIYLDQDKYSFEQNVNSTILSPLQNYDYSQPLFNVNSYKKNIDNLIIYHGANSDRLTPDHIPSIAAIFKYLNVAQKRGNNNNYEQNSSTINIYRTWHKDGSFTFFWKNTKPLIEKDSKDLREATIRDLSVMGAYILKNSSEKDKIKYISNGIMLYSRNAALCLYSNY